VKVRLAPLAVLVLLAAGGCGGGERVTPRATGTGTSPAPTPSNVVPDVAGTRRAADAASVRVIRAWTDAERSSDLERATSYFALPALIENGSGPEELTSRAAVLQFHRDLPCGAVLLGTSAGTRRGYVVALFRLVGRPGVACDGTGARAQTAFRIRGGKIFEWLRLPDVAPPRGGGATPPQPGTGSQAA
jgi:hypothetical protein